MADPSKHINRIFDLSGRTALVTGGSGYLGTAIAESLAELGASVVLTSRDETKAQVAAEKLPRVGAARHCGVALNQIELDTIPARFSTAVQRAGKIDILVNNAHERTIDDWKTVTPEHFSGDLNNCTAFFLLSRLFREHIVSRKSAGSVINVGSMYGLVGSYPLVYEGIMSASPVSYHATKGAVVHLTRHLAVYWAKDGVRVNCLCPGPFPFPDGNPEMIRRLNDRVPMGRIGQAWEVKGAAAFLASDASSYVTGQMLVVDGGWTAW